MTNQTRHRFAALTIALALGACVDKGELPGPPFEAMVLDQTGYDPNYKVGKHELVRASLDSINDFEELTGPLYQFRRGGILRARDIAGSVIADGQFREGESPDLRYVVRDGAAIARDYNTLVMLSSAYQFEQLLPRLKDASGYGVEELQRKYGRMVVFFEPRIELEGATVIHQTGKFNAFFNPAGGQFGLARRSSAEDTPLAIDRKAIGHELGHAVFQLDFYHGEDPNCDEDLAERNEREAWFPGRLPYEFVIAGLNEGFADWHSFTLTHAVDVLANQSLPEPDERDITMDTFDWDDLPTDEDEADEDDLKCHGAFYCLGTMFARSLYRTFEARGLDPDDEADRYAFMHEVAAALNTVQDSMRAADSLPVSDDKVAKCERREYLTPELDAPILGGFMQALLEALPDETAALLCPELAQRFKDGFPEENRVGCEAP